ncbi:hypothetical protein DPMN_158402 [Dreissena polymorpha]|uniref:Uncharacterized protein n=1 Tax=Dreissena polymorpha TaxID=45954 RepID=A0A9D4EJS0_DREPO|nr:hypothetical protein DPMN_158402 [Dreissena polymorpha]
MSMLSVTDTGESICKNTFSIIVRAGDKLVLGVEQVERTYRVMSYDQKIMFLPVFITTAEDPKYTTDVGCTQIGTVMIPLAGLGKNRSVLVRMFLGGTEIIVECVEEATGRITRLYTDFLM